MAGKVLSAGDIIEAKCTRCKKVMNHTIIAMLGDRPARVECNTCKGAHNYHPPTTAKTRTVSSGRVGTPRKKKTDPAAAERDEWIALRLDMELNRAKPYDMNSPYRVNDLLKHPKFGLGVVKQIAGPNKVAILFADGMKILRCG